MFVAKCPVCGSTIPPGLSICPGCFTGRESKYGNKKTYVDGLPFDSKKEATRYCELKLLVKAGAIKDLQRQVKFELIPKQDGEKAVYYVADFLYTDAETGERIVEDTKGFKTKDYVIKRKLMLYRHGIKIHEI